VTPARGVNPASIPGSYAKRGAASIFTANGNLDYNGGPVLHAEAPYLIFWDPGGQIPAADKTLYERFFADGATDSGMATNVYSVNRQFTDSTGFADYRQTWSASHAITDTHAYPITGTCMENAGFTETACLFDSQIQAEVARLVTANGLPAGVTGNAPIYFVVTPATVNSCFDSSPNICADNTFCAYHSSFTDGASDVLYANMPTVVAANQPKDCQVDGNSMVQKPNNQQIADVNIKAISHEYNETITDPLGTGWWNSSSVSGLENGDNCNAYGATVDPNGGANPNAFTPTLGGSAAGGTLFNQAMNANPYYAQSEWSNGDANCEMKASPTALSAAFSVPSATPPGISISLDPSGSASSAGYTSTSWDFGDGTTSFARSAPTAQTHAYAANGTYTVTLTEVDAVGNLSTTSHTVTVHDPPSAGFTVTTAGPKAASPVGFSGSSSAEPGGSIASYSWNFGDGSAPGSGPTTAHAFASAGTYSVALTVTGSFGLTAMTSHVLTVVGVPAAVITPGRSTPVAGSAHTFSGSGSTDVGSSIASYRWNFGDGSTASGVNPSHTYRRTGRVTVSLTVTDASGSSSTIAKSVAVKSASIASISITKGKTIEKLTLVLTGPGTLSVGELKFKIKHAGRFVFKLELSRAQRDRLSHHHSLKVKVTFKFKPKVGSSSTKTVSFKVKD
jgi:PKD repeat protein